MRVGIVEAAGEEARGRRFVRRVEDGCRRIERAQADDEALSRLLPLRRVDEIGLAQHDAIGDRDLLHRFHVRVERGVAVHRVDHGDHAVEPVAHHQIGVRHRGLQHRRGIGEAGRLQDHAAERCAAVVEIAQQLLQRIDEVAAQVQHRQPLCSSTTPSLIALDQQVVEADLAELVDDDGGLGERRDR